MNYLIYNWSFFIIFGFFMFFVPIMDMIKKNKNKSSEENFLNLDIKTIFWYRANIISGLLFMSTGMFLKTMSFIVKI